MAATSSHQQQQQPPSGMAGCTAAGLNAQLVVDLPYSAQQLSTLLGILYEHTLEVSRAGRQQRDECLHALNAHCAVPLWNGVDPHDSDRGQQQPVSRHTGRLLCAL